MITTPTIRIDLPSWQALRADAKVIEADHYGDKVLQLADGSYLKLFRRKRLLTSALWSPYAQRFVDNCHAIRARGIACPEIIALYRIRAIKRDAVHYKPLAGETLRRIVRQHPSEAQAETLRHDMGHFVARLHDLGIYFRSLHLGNIVCTPHGEFGLIDLSDLRLHRAPLNRLRRRRNMKHLLRNVGEAIWLTAGGTFFAAYQKG
jgi:tRNA A-37 threonylcarbamoyl transferase component Bud32